ncbi:MAG: prepilin-type N-terminal cleavage/methylation domain-containing protein [Deltaproteobacteria bacterium]|nr:prepilin-type N-terminal cleavage/methylation domain-containing protein [Deltaproteobacteria bacterium]MBZ0221231.1 prepilin-type N-terminal cleavage/methylation domain-containing protein [Deltaproteobacteria bacterium]
MLKLMRTGQNKGFTLIELLIAISVLAVGILGVATMMTTGIMSGRFAHMVAAESSVAVSVLEELMSRDGSDPVFSSNITNAVYDLDPSSAATGMVVQGRMYSAVYSVVPNSPVAGVASIEVVITSNGRMARYASLKSVL